MPSLLLEMGYATDEGDAAKLNDAGWCSLFIKAVADGIEAGI
jgi:N-acetylmuramoyl-L-alanine amidase